MPLVKIQSNELKNLLHQDPLLKIVDVREIHEYEQGHILNAIHHPLSSFLKDFFSTSEHYVFYCKSGYRSTVAAEHLLDHYHDMTVYNLTDGIDGWIGAGFELS